MRRDFSVVLPADTAREREARVQPLDTLERRKGRPLWLQPGTWTSEAQVSQATQAELRARAVCEHVLLTSSGSSSGADRVGCTH